MTKVLLRDDMRALVGVAMETAVSFPVAASDIRRWAIAVHHPDPPPLRYWDLPEDELVAPEEFNPFAWGPRHRELAAGPGADATYDVGAPERRLGVEPPPYTQLLNGGLGAEYTGVGIRPGDVITSTLAIVEYAERNGRAGPLLFTTIESRWLNQRDEPVCTHRMTLIRS
jgi:hypothetical protein